MQQPGHPPVTIASKLACQLYDFFAQLFFIVSALQRIALRRPCLSYHPARASLGDFEHFSHLFDCFGEWLNSWGNELENMSRIVRMLLFVKLPGVEGKNEKDQGVTQCVRTARETTRLSRQAGQVVA
jgi:hypothetical protein